MGCKIRKVAIGPAFVTVRQLADGAYAKVVAGTYLPVEIPEIVHEQARAGTLGIDQGVAPSALPRAELKNAASTQPVIAYQGTVKVALPIKNQATPRNRAVIARREVVQHFLAPCSIEPQAKFEDCAAVVTAA